VGGVDLIFINISRVAHAQRAASLPTNPRGPHVEQIEEARKETERREKVREDGGGEARGKGDEKRAPMCMRVQLLMSVCIGYERSVVSGERERERERPRVREGKAPKDPRRTKWSPLILRRALQSASFSGILAFLISHRFFLVPSLSYSSSFFSLLSSSPSLSLFTLYLLPPVQVFPHANAKSTELLGIIAAPGLDSRREYISSTLGGKLCPWSTEGVKEGRAAISRL